MMPPKTPKRRVSSKDPIKRTEKAQPAPVPKGEKRATGRPCLMTAQTVGRLFAGLRQGLWRDDAAALAGLGVDTLDSWIARGRAEIQKADIVLQSTGAMPRYTKWANFVTDLVVVEVQLRAKLLGIMFEIADTRAPSTENDENGDPIPGVLMYPDAAFRCITWYLSRKDNKRYGSGSQRTDLIRGGSADDLDGIDPGQFVLEQIARALALKKHAADQAGDAVGAE